MAFSVYNNPGVYALLLGSGVSRAAEIPTGWEIVKDLIKQIAVAQGEAISENPIEWYEEEHGIQPRYDDLLAKLGKASAERNSILRRYFEASAEERERDDKIKSPTRAHRSIAQMIKDGFIRVVLTTNFDRLLENALMEIGIVPDVVSTDSMLEGARPPQHSAITIYKLHGDYRDDSFKNIAGELAEYTPQWNALLDRIIDEYGLIVCGWSADWDIALRQALERAKTRRYSTFWGSYSEQLSETTQMLIKQRDGQLIAPISADEMFVELQQAVEALHTFRRVHPMSVTIAVERIKKLIPHDTTQIELEDLMLSETECAYKAFTSQELISQFEELVIQRLHTAPIETWQELLTLSYSACEIPLNLAATLAWYGNSQQASLIRRVLMRWFELPRGQAHSQIAHSISGLLLIYMCGIAAIYRSNWPYLSALLNDNKVKDFRRSHEVTMSVAEEIIDTIYDHFQFANGPRSYTQVSQLIQDVVHQAFGFCLPSPTKFEVAFDLFEAFFEVFLLYETNKNEIGPSLLIPPRLHPQIHIPRSLDHILEFWAIAGEKGVSWGPLQVGLFESDPEALKAVLILHKEKMIARGRSYDFPVRMPRHYIDAYSGDTNE